MSASQLRQPPSARRRATSAGPTGVGDQPPRKSPIPSWLPYAGAALIGVWLLQLVVGPLLPGAAEIPYSEFKTKLAVGPDHRRHVGHADRGSNKKPERQDAPGRRQADSRRSRLQTTIRTCIKSSVPHT